MTKQAKGLAEKHTSSKFAEGLCFRKLFFVFLIGSVIGAFYEEILNLVQVLWQTGQWEWSLRRGVIYGPFNVIYGFGAALLVWLMARDKYSSWQVFLFSALAGGAFEYLVSYLQELFTHTVSWDYSHQLLNLNGRTTIPIMLVWGVMGLAVIKLLYPMVSNLVERMPYDTGTLVFRVLLIFMILNMLVSWTALIRQTLRHNNVPAFTPIDRFYDSYYTDERLKHYFPNMNHLDKK